MSNRGKGVLLRGPSGAGKSDLALRLMAPPRSWQLVADDQVLVRRSHGGLSGEAPPTIAGKLEVRGIGIVAAASAANAAIRLIVDLVPRADVPRMPETGETAELLGVLVPRCRLHAFDASCPDKIALLLGK